MSGLKDKLGYSFHVGCKVARAEVIGQTPMLTIRKVTRIENGKLYLDNSKIPIRYPNRLLIIEQDPLYRMVKNYDKGQQNSEENVK